MIEIKEKFNLTKFLFEGNHIPLSTKAMVWNDKEFTRETLYDNIIKTADYLVKTGVKKGERIVLLLNDTPAIYELFLGAIAIGAIPIVINPKTKLSDIKYIINDSKATSIATEIRELKELEHIYNNSPFLISRNKIIIQDRYVSNLSILKENKEYFYPRLSKVVFIEDEDLEMSFVLKDKDDPAFWQYTSGTTGKPKAVVHSQLSMLSNTINFAEKTLNITRNDCIYSVPKMFFGYGLGNSLFFPLWTGAKVIIDDNWPHVDKITNIIETYKPTVFFAVPKVYGLLLKNDRKINYDSVSIFYSAGSHLNATVNTRWKNKTGKHITQGIGCTEIGHVYISTIPKHENINATGKPVEGFNIKLQKKENSTIGELYVQPSFKLLGYHNANYENKFLADNWYKTSDNFTKDENENYLFSSRVDDLFKINGRMVVPSVIENYVIENFPVHEAVYVGIEDEEISDVKAHLCLTLVNETYNESQIIEAITNQLKSEMPGYMQPHKISVFKEFEYNSNGKIIKNKIVKELTATLLV